VRFSEVIGQKDVKKHLVEMVAQNRLSHALLFMGREGTGSLPLAIAFSQYIMCENRGESDACGVCNSCKKASGLVHPDIHFSYPVIPKKPGDKPVSTDYVSEWREFVEQYPYGNIYDWLQFIAAENKQGNITAEECNDIIHKLSLKSFESEYKVLVLWMPEYLEKQGNKLLKLIEEPPANTVFILVAENEAMILPTIVSRTQIVRIPAIDTGAIENELLLRANISKEQARQIASVSNGNYRESMQILQNSSEDWQSLIREWLNAIMKSGPVAQVKWIEEISRHGREKQKQFLRYFNHLLSQAIKVNVLKGAEFPMPENEKDFALRLNKMAGLEQQHAMIEELDKASYYIERNANPKMLFHALTIKLYHIIADKSVILTI
jgi:DNA polymerase III subunit delta'